MKYNIKPHQSQAYCPQVTPSIRDELFLLPNRLLNVTLDISSLPKIHSYNNMQTVSRVEMYKTPDTLTVT